MRAKLSQIERPVEVVLVGRHAYVVGLFWQPSKSGRSARKDALAFAKQQGFQWVSFHESRPYLNAGMATHVVGTNRKTYSLAAALGARFGANWIAVFQTGPDRYVMAASRNGAITPGSDRAGTEAEIRGAYEQHLGDTPGDDYLVVVAPPGWRGATIVQGLEEALRFQRPPRSIALRPTTLRLTKRHILIAAMCLSSAVSVTTCVMKYRAHLQDAERQARIEAAAAAEEAARSAEVNRRIVAGPWKDQAPAADVVVHCTRGLHALPVEIAGWLFTTSRCTPDRLEGTYRRMGTATLGAFSDATGAQFGKPEILENGEAATIHFTAQLPLVEEPELAPIIDQLTALVSHMQQRGQSLEVQAVRKGGVATGEGYTDEVAAWHANDWKLKTNVPPGEVFKGLSLHGLRISSIDTGLVREVSELSWEIEGTIYGK